jgi:hypothetical protein
VSRLNHHRRNVTAAAIGGEAILVPVLVKKNPPFGGLQVRSRAT